MPGANLTRIEAEERKSVIAAPVHYTVKLDLTRGAKNSVPKPPSRSMPSRELPASLT